MIFLFSSSLFAFHCFLGRWPSYFCILTSHLLPGIYYDTKADITLAGGFCIDKQGFSECQICCYSTERSCNCCEQLVCRQDCLQLWLQNTIYKTSSRQQTICLPHIHSLSSIYLLQPHDLLPGQQYGCSLGCLGSLQKLLIK